MLLKSFLKQKKTTCQQFFKKIFLKEKKSNKNFSRRVKREKK